MRIELEVCPLLPIDFVPITLDQTDTLSSHTASRALNPKEWPHWGHNQNVVALYGVRFSWNFRFWYYDSDLGLKSTSSSGQHIRTERFGSLMDYTAAFTKVSEFYTDKRKFGAASESFRSGSRFSRSKCRHPDGTRRKVDGYCGRPSEKSDYRPCPCN